MTGDFAHDAQPGHDSDETVSVHQTDRELTVNRGRGETVGVRLRE